MTSTGQTEGALPSLASANCACPTCGRPIANSTVDSSVDLSTGISGQFASDEGSLSHPPAPAAAFESEMSAAEELKLLKTQIRDVRRVCEAIARGDFSQKVTVPVQDDDMVHLKDDINTMVSLGCSSVVIIYDLMSISPLCLTSALMTGAKIWLYVLGRQDRPNCEGSHSCIPGIRYGRVCFETSLALMIKIWSNNLLFPISLYLFPFPSYSKLGGQVYVPDVEGSWQELITAINGLAASHTSYIRSVAMVTRAVVMGDLSQRMEVDAEGEILDLKNTVNGVVNQLKTLTEEITRVTLEVGSEGIMGGQAVVPNAEGVWEQLTVNVSYFINVCLQMTDVAEHRQVNRMSSTLAYQVRSISEVTKAVGNGDLSKSVTVDALGEILDLKMTVNTMVSQFSTLTNEVIKMSVEVGTDGKLGGQVVVSNVQGVWKVCIRLAFD